MKSFWWKSIALVILAAICCLSFACCDKDDEDDPSESQGVSVSDSESAGVTTAPVTTPTGLSLNEEGLYMIYTAEDLVLYRDMYDEAAQKFYDENGASEVFVFPGLILMADIDLSSVCGAGIGNWKPIGTDAYCDKTTGVYYSETFTGTFDGNGKTLSGLYINDPEQGGALINCIWEGTVKDLTIADSTILGVNSEGGSGLYCAAIALEARDGLIENCVIEDSVIIQGDSGAAGFLVKAKNWNYKCVIRNCKNYADIKTDGMAGGIVTSASAGVYIVGCENHGDITSYGDGANYLGGIIGAHTGSSNYGGMIYGCINYGDVTETINQRTEHVAGIAGTSNTTIEYCANAGNITGTEGAFDITHFDEGARHYNVNYGTVTSEIDPEFAISSVYKKSSYKGINYPLGTPALTDGTALAEIINNSGEYWKQGEQFPVWNGEFSYNFPKNLQTKGAIVE